MNFEISKNKCEICGQQANVAMNDLQMILHYACLYHIEEVYKKHTVDKLNKK